MEQNQDFGIEVDEEGRLIVPPDIRARYGIRPNTRIRSSDLGNGLFVSSPTRLVKLYIEPTSLCNLDCRTCIRNSWDAHPGMMSEKTIRDAMLAQLPKDKLIFLYCLCEEGADSSETALLLRRMGFRRDGVKVLEGGLIQWDEKGYPMIKNEAPEGE